ncbi:MAG: FtsX-like permease family protein [Bacteroidia bacterium]|nr:FtsX-like permease family protein [Bacteroidia bacterium]
MSLSRFISQRYLFSKKSTNVINIITGVSVVGITVGTAAMIIVLSVFNGLTGLIESLFSAMDSDLRIEASAGSTFTHSDSLVRIIQNQNGVKYISKTIEGKAGLKYFDRQAQAVIKGVDSIFSKINPIDSVAYLYEGSYTIHNQTGTAQAILGALVAETLNANIKDEVNPIHVFLKTDGPIVAGNPMPSFRNDLLFPSGFFSIQKEYDEKFILVDFDVAREWFNMKDKITAYEIAVNNPAKINTLKSSLQNVLGPGFRVLTLPDRHETLYKVMKNEKYISFLILILLVAIAAINIVGSLSMIVLEKTKDIAILKSMGATDSIIRKIFLMEGFWVGGLGVISGLITGYMLVFLQIRFKLLKLPNSDNFRFDAFPVRADFSDFILVLFTVLLLSIFAALYPSLKASKVSIGEGLKK